MKTITVELSLKDVTAGHQGTEGIPEKTETEAGTRFNLFASGLAQIGADSSPTGFMQRHGLIPHGLAMVM